jgi:hypothetical protein
LLHQIADVLLGQVVANAIQLQLLAEFVKGNIVILVGFHM